MTVPEPTKRPAILVEVKATPSASGDLSSKSLAPEDFRTRADEVAQSLVEVAEQFREHLDSVPEAPKSGLGLDQVVLTFSIDVKAEAGVIIARTSASATFTASLTWKRHG